MQIKFPAEIVDIFKTFEKKGFEIYLVGGAVRDLIMGRIVRDWDFTTNAVPDEILAMFGEDAFYNNSFGTVGIPAKDDDFLPHEITTFRTEQSYSDNRRPDKVEWGETLEEDLKRRDFTINAIALTKDKKIVDPYKGEKDIDRKLVRAVGEPTERFGEDALRMMRAVRIAAELGYEIDHETFEAIKMNAGSINKIAKERVRDEFLKILASANPYEGMVMFRNAGLMDLIIPELTKTFGVEQKSPERHHIYDVGTHLMYSLKACKSTDPIVRFATLIHDIGKPQTYRRLASGVITFYNHEVVGANIAARISERLKLSNRDSKKLYTLVREHQFTVSENQTDTAIRRFIRKVGKENIEGMMDLRTADRLGGGASETSWRTEEFKARILEVQKQPFTVHDLKIKGDEVMKILNLKPGPEVGSVLKRLFKAVENKEVKNKKAELLAFLKSSL